MELLKWTEDISLDHPLIDRQHQELFDFVNRMIENNGSDNELVKETLLNLKTYSETHFRDEEAIMEAIAYPDLEDHKFEHRFFVLRITTFYNELQNNNQDLSQKILEFLVDWLGNHMSVGDQNFKNYL